MALNSAFWKNKKVFVTGATGFKGSWMVAWLKVLGADVSGFSLAPDATHRLFPLLQKTLPIAHVDGDIRDRAALAGALKKFRPDIVIHMAAQPLVLRSYADPVETFTTNFNGTLNLLEEVRALDSVRAVVNVTTDKVYENLGGQKAFSESDALGGWDPYSASKATSEIVSQSYLRSFFADGKKGLATARAGNVIGGGDFADNRIIPDCARDLFEKKNIEIRNPSAVRPWQHVLEPISGYLQLAEKLFADPAKFSGSWNFGPNPDSAASVETVATEFFKLAGDQKALLKSTSPKLHEAAYLMLTSEKAKRELGWQPRLNLTQTVQMTFDGYKAFYQAPESFPGVMRDQIQTFSEISR